MNPLGLTVASSTPLSGGVSRARLADGRHVILKRGQGGGATITEAASLRWLAETETVRVPEVVAVDDEWLALPEILAGQPNAVAAEEFGRALARMHDAGANAFGAAPPGAGDGAWIGNTEMRNVEAATWPRWYAETRVLPFLRDAGVRLPAVERVCEHIEDVAGPQEKPARLHGDLWSGNVFWGADGQVWLIDPAAHGGHRETDLAMLHLFGCPHLDRIIDAYNEVSPLADGYRARIPLHQLFPLLVHTVLFGGGYAARAHAAAEAVLRTTS
jgi:fructosamine-3-kinase